MIAQPRLVVFDVDGVLVTRPQGFGALQIPSTTQAAIQQLQAENILCTVATGRGYLRTLQACGGRKWFNPSQLLIVEECKIVAAHGEILHAPLIDHHTLEAVAPLLTRKLVHFAGGCCPWNQHLYKFWACDVAARELIEQQLALIAGQITEDAVEFIRWLKDDGTSMLALKTYGNQLPIPPEVSWTLNERIYNITAPDQDKGIALQKLADRLEIPLTRVVACVNDHNDLPLARLAGTVVVVGNKVPELTALATHYVETPEDLHIALQAIFPEILSP